MRLDFDRNRVRFGFALVSTLLWAGCGTENANDSLLTSDKAKPTTSSKVSEDSHAKLFKFLEGIRDTKADKVGERKILGDCVVKGDTFSGLAVGFGILNQASKKTIRVWMPKTGGTAATTKGKDKGFNDGKSYVVLNWYGKQADAMFPIFHTKYEVQVYLDEATEKLVRLTAKTSYFPASVLSSDARVSMDCQ